MRDLNRVCYPAPESHRCACCGADIGCGDHDDGCADRSLELAEVEAFAALAPIEAMYPDLQPLTPSTRQILSGGGACVGADANGGAEQVRSAQDVGGVA
jgi:hypothetical protein